MQRWTVIGLFVLAVGCGKTADGDAGDVGETGDTDVGETGEESNDESGTGGGMGSCPAPDGAGRDIYWDEWETVLDGVELPADVVQLSVGGRSVDGNFMNRGDVEVHFTGPPGTARVDLRRFTSATDHTESQEHFDRLSLWGFSGTVVPPGSKSSDEDCTAAFHNGCQIRVYYDDLIQPIGLGADIRVILPAGWAGALEISTEDANQNAPLRSDVKVADWAGALVEVELDSGEVDIKFADDVLVAPLCGAALNQTCDSWVDPDTNEPAAWSLDCGCTDFGKVDVESRPERAANIRVDVPSDFWATARQENSQPGLSMDSDPLCVADVDCDSFGLCEEIDYDPNFPWRHSAEVNDPGDANLAGTGYQVNAVSQACQMVEVFDPETCESQMRVGGQLEFCSGCVEIESP
jgi:hypothetical protein